MSASSIAVVAAVISALAAICSAGISAVMNFSLAKRTSSQKVAEMRRDWIEDLRTHVAKFGAAAASRVSAKLADRKIPSDDCQFEYQYIILKLNLSEPKHNDLYRAMNAMMTIGNEAIQIDELSSAQKSDTNQRFQQQIESFTRTATSIFKEEWKRLQTEIHQGT